MGGMFTVVKVRDDLAVGDYRDPGWYAHPPGTVAQRVSLDPNYGTPVRKGSTGANKVPSQAPTTMPDMPGMKHGG